MPLVAVDGHDVVIHYQSGKWYGQCRSCKSSAGPLAHSEHSARLRLSVEQPDHFRPASMADAERISNRVTGMIAMEQITGARVTPVQSENSYRVHVLFASHSDRWKAGLPSFIDGIYIDIEAGTYRSRARNRARPIVNLPTL